jgi:hypothetical protein
MSETFSLLNKTKGNLSDELPFEDIKNEVLGKEYELSLVLFNERRNARDQLEDSRQK